MSDTLMIRPKRNHHSGKLLSGFALIKKKDNPDLSEHVFLQDRENCEEWVHKDDYEYYKELSK